MPQQASSKSEHLNKHATYEDQWWAKLRFITEKDIKYKSKLLENEPIFGSNEYHT